MPLHEFGVKYIMAPCEAQLRFWRVELRVLSTQLSLDYLDLSKSQKVAVLPGLEGKGPCCGGGS